MFFLFNLKRVKYQYCLHFFCYLTRVLEGNLSNSNLCVGVFVVHKSIGRLLGVFLQSVYQNQLQSLHVRSVQTLKEKVTISFPYLILVYLKLIFETNSKKQCSLTSSDNLKTN